MQFTYSSYSQMIDLLKNNCYSFETYHSWENKKRCVIMRHDIDQSLALSAKFADLEASLGVKSTYFVLLTSDFYNPMSIQSQKYLSKIQSLGHEIGLHFDEVAYRNDNKGSITDHILHEIDILSKICNREISVVSMHRPSKETLERNITIPGVINSYSKIFFQEFKYLSDSRRHWREPAEDIINSCQYDRLHILTHSFWYHEIEEDMKNTIKNFVNKGNIDRYMILEQNITDLNKVMSVEDVI